MILILAAGNQQRWGKSPIKQLLPIGDLTIIDRIVNQVGMGIVVTHIDELRGKFISYKPKNHRFTCETLLDTKNTWFNQVIILLGDVIYSHNVINQVLDCKDKFRVFGNEWEIFALSFQSHQRILDMLHLTIRQAEDGRNKGTLRNFCNNYFGVAGAIHHLSGFENICHINDYTNDIDSPEEYKAFLEQHLITMRHDENS